MILIFSQEIDPTTDTVIDWISYYNHSFCRINPKDLINAGLSIDFDKKIFQIEINGKIIKSTDIHSIWFRRWHQLPIINEDIQNQQFFLEINKAKEMEFLSIFRSFEFCLKDKFWLNKFNDIRVPKVTQLMCAKQVRLLIPKTFILNNKKELTHLLSKNKKVLTKASEYTLQIEGYASYSNRVTNETLSEIPTMFFPSLFQTEIEKEIELRIVFINGIFYTMAIFSQQIEQTEVDFRRYSFDYPNRTICFELPINIKRKISKLMKLLDLNFGSIDMIKSKSGEYYFLEVNPVGQFGMVSSPCNYNIEKKIAQILIENDRKNNN